MLKLYPSFPVKPPKYAIKRLLVQKIPEFAELLWIFQENGGWIRLPQPFIDLKEQLDIHNYVEMYSDERKAANSIFGAMFTPDQARAINDQVNALSHAEQREWLEKLAQDENPFGLGPLFEVVETADAELAVQNFGSLPAAARARVLEQARALSSGFFVLFFNVLSMMVHGRRMFDLVRAAKHGDDDALLMAAQIDRSLFTHDKYFANRRQRAFEYGEKTFLSKLAYREKTPTLQGRIKFPGLWIMFALLDSMDCLEMFTREEITDICVEACLERFQPVIEEANTVTKVLLAYKERQKESELSMQ